MKNNIIIRLSGLFFSCFFFFQPAGAQQTVTLKQCYKGAYTTSMLAGETKSYSEISALKEKNISKGWLPSLDVNATAMYNSEVVDLSPVLGNIPIPGIASALQPMPHDQYKITLDINQVIFDGGAARSAKEMEKADLKVNEKQTETDLYKLRAQINTYYFSIILLKRQKDLLNNYHELLEKRLLSVQSAIENGILMKTDADVLNSELINLEQQLSENGIKTISFIQVLSGLTGIQIDTSAELITPKTAPGIADTITRPEIDLFDMRKNQLAAGEALISSKRLPKAFGFATLGYGNPPGNNFFRDEFAPYYIVGAGLKWNIFDWNKSRNEKQVISLQKGIIENRKADLTDNLKRQLRLKEAEIINLEKLSESDSSLIEIRKRITSAAGSQQINGTITSTEYLNILNTEKQARINSEIHSINLALARIDYMNISGKEIE